MVDPKSYSAYDGYGDSKEKQGLPVNSVKLRHQNSLAAKKAQALAGVVRNTILRGTSRYDCDRIAFISKGSNFRRLGGQPFSFRTTKRW